MEIVEKVEIVGNSVRSEGECKKCRRVYEVWKSVIEK